MLELIDDPGGTAVPEPISVPLLKSVTCCWIAICLTPFSIVDSTSWDGFKSIKRFCWSTCSGWICPWLLVMGLTSR